jgi:ABC-type polysaccharide/polyol phosphate export permease
LNWNSWVRQFHRWVAIAFVAVVVVVSVIGGTQEDPAEWVFLTPLLPLALLVLTGLNLFVLPYASRWRSNRRA